MNARTLAALVASYNSARCRYIITVTEPVLERPLHGSDHGILALGCLDVVEDAPPSGRTVPPLHTPMSPRQSQSLQG